MRLFFFLSARSQLRPSFPPAQLCANPDNDLAGSWWRNREIPRTCGNCAPLFVDREEGRGSSPRAPTSRRSSAGLPLREDLYTVLISSQGDLVEPQPEGERLYGLHDFAPGTLSDGASDQGDTQGDPTARLEAVPGQERHRGRARSRGIRPQGCQCRTEAVPID